MDKRAVKTYLSVPTRRKIVVKEENIVNNKTFLIICNNFKYKTVYKNYI